MREGWRCQNVRLGGDRSDIGELEWGLGKFCGTDQVLCRLRLGYDRDTLPGISSDGRVNGHVTLEGGRATYRILSSRPGLPVDATAERDLFFLPSANE
jgi:hypothetical protein